MRETADSLPRAGGSGHSRASRPSLFRRSAGTAQGKMEGGGDEMATKEPILLTTLRTGKEVRCMEYDCDEAVVLGTFKPGFVAAWDAISDPARGILEEYWDDGAAVILKQGSPDWAERKLGFALSSYDGKSMYCWSEVLKDIPLRVLLTTIVHELGHMAFIATKEPAHVAKKGEAEYLIAELLRAWGMSKDQEVADLWLSENFWEHEVGIPRRAEPLHKELIERRRKEREAKMQKDAKAREDYRASVQEYFDRVAGSPPAASANLKRAE